MPIKSCRAICGYVVIEIFKNMRRKMAISICATTNKTKPSAQNINQMTFTFSLWTKLSSETLFNLKSPKTTLETLNTIKKNSIRLYYRTFLALVANTCHVHPKYAATKVVKLSFANIVRLKYSKHVRSVQTAALHLMKRRTKIGFIKI